MGRVELQYFCHRNSSAQSMLQNSGLPTFLQEAYIHQLIRNYTTVRGPDILRNVIVSGYVIFYKINTFFMNVLLFIIIDKVFCI